MAINITRPLASGVDEELGGRRDTRFTVGCLVTPQRDQEVHRHQHHLPEEEEQEHVDGRGTRRSRRPRIHIRFRWKKPSVFFDFSPGSKVPPERRADRSARPSAATDRQSPGWIVIPKRGIHGRMNSDCHCGRPADWVSEVATLQPQLQAKRERQSHGDQRDPARHLHAKAFGLPAQEAADEGN